MSNNPQQGQAALSDFWNSTLPMSQVRESLAPPNGWYNHTILKLEPGMGDDGVVYIQGSFKSHASETPGQVPIDYQQRFYVGTQKDPQAKQPETRLNSIGLSQLKGIARVCDVPTQDQPTAQLCASLVGKQFTNRIEERKYKDKQGNEKSAINFGRNPVKLGLVPARLDGTPLGASVGTNGSIAPAPASAEVAGATFGSE